MKTSISHIFYFLILAKFCANAQVSLTFNPARFTAQSQEFQGKIIKVRAFEKIIYVSNPADSTLEILNIYVPEEYFNGGNINGYTAETAPIFSPIE